MELLCLSEFLSMHSAPRWCETQSSPFDDDVFFLKNLILHSRFPKRSSYSSPLTCSTDYRISRKTPDQSAQCACCSFHTHPCKSLWSTLESFLTHSHTLHMLLFFPPHLKLYKWIANKNLISLTNLLSSWARKYFVSESWRGKELKLKPHWQAFRKACHTTMSPFLCLSGWSFCKKWVMYTFTMHRCTHRTYVHGSVLNFIHSHLALLGMFVYVSLLCVTLYMFAVPSQIFLSDVSKSFSRLSITAPLKCLQNI